MILLIKINLKSLEEMVKGKAAEVSLFVFDSVHVLHTGLSIPWHLDPCINLSLI